MSVITEKYSVPAKNQLLQNKDVKKSPCKTTNGQQVAVISNTVKLINHDRLSGFCQQAGSPFQKPVRIIAGVIIFLSQTGYAVTDSLDANLNNTGNGDSELSNTSKVVTFVSLGCLGLMTLGLACCGLIGYAYQRSNRSNEQTAGRVQEQIELREFIHKNEEDNQSDNISTEDTGIDPVWIKRY
ncbi:hypothetical protein [Endozoicomonas sp.]|uniref:hypothetical protein n=1 Tax=Endozoicomonas sp. TaxID=1892382 RepID=UPI002886DC0C|nr:hypothetical protein [Endozoicomonas sp.]